MLGIGDLNSLLKVAQAAAKIKNGDKTGFAELFNFAEKSGILGDVNEKMENRILVFYKHPAHGLTLRIIETIGEEEIKTDYFLKDYVNEGS